jgi:adenylate cyclase
VRWWRLRAAGARHLSAVKGSAEQGDPAVERLIADMLRRLNWIGFGGNTVGALTVAAFLSFLTPRSGGTVNTLLVRNGIVLAIFMPLGLAAGRYLSGQALNRTINPWLRSGRTATEEERQQVLRYPATFAWAAGAIWALAALVFAVVNIDRGAALVIVIPVTVLLGGLTACSLEYLLVERAMRPVTALALAGRAPRRSAGPGVSARLLSAWTLATGVPLLGIVAFTVLGLTGSGASDTRTIAAALFLAVLGLSIGSLTIRIATRSVAEPMAAVRAAFARIEEGDLGARVQVDDGSEVGLLEAGFNSMASGLEERERLRDLFGRHVGRDVAKAALTGEIALGGEEREIAALFVDLVGSTTLAARRPPAEVVKLLNDFFRLVVAATEAHNGLVNKFEGDAALCVFGAPVATADPAGDALAAAREIRRALQRDLPEVDIGIGVSAGTAVAGNIGAEERFEYTVIGDPVNEAARLCELAKARPERVLASDAALERASDSESEVWTLGDAVTLRGRDAETRLATLAD